MEIKYKFLVLLLQPDALDYDSCITRYYMSPELFGGDHCIKNSFGQQ